MLSVFSLIYSLQLLCFLLRVMCHVLYSFCICFNTWTYAHINEVSQTTRFHTCTHTKTMHVHSERHTLCVCTVSSNPQQPQLKSNGFQVHSAGTHSCKARNIFQRTRVQTHATQTHTHAHIHAYTCHPRDKKESFHPAAVCNPQHIWQKDPIVTKNPEPLSWMPNDVLSHSRHHVHISLHV